MGRGRRVRSQGPAGGLRGLVPREVQPRPVRPQLTLCEQTARGFQSLCGAFGLLQDRTLRSGAGRAGDGRNLWVGQWLHLPGSLPLQAVRSAVFDPSCFEALPFVRSEDAEETWPIRLGLGQSLRPP